MDAVKIEYRPHPLADIFPLIAGDEFVALKQDIKANGLQEPIWLLDGKILDGRNRFKACQEADVTPKFRHYEGHEPAQFVLSLNLRRRHLDKSQAAAIAVEFLPHLEAEAKERQRGSGGDRKSDEYQKSVGEKIPQAITPEKKQQREPKSTAKAAKLTGTNEKYVQKAKTLKDSAPDKFEQVKAGQKTITQAERELKEEKREATRNENRSKIAEVSTEQDISALNIQFSTIVIDPPWDWGDEGDCDQLGRARPDYQTMGFGQLKELPVSSLALPDAHIYLWITNRSLPKGFSLLETWGFRYITCLTWVKPHFGMGNYFRGQTEHVLFGVRGSLPLKRKDVGTSFAAPRGPNGHSSKPVEFLSLVESCSPGPYLEMFSRNERADWTTWGQGGVISA